MKTRIIKTRIWSEDDKFGQLSSTDKLAFVYLLSNSRVGMTNYYECPDRIIMFETSLTDNQLEKSKAQLQNQNMAYFYRGWVCLPHLEKHNNYRNGEKNEIAYVKEKEAIPSNILEYFDSTIDSSIYTDYKSKTINHKSKVINKKPEIRNDEDEILAKALLQRWNETHGTKHTAWKPLMKNLDYWKDQYTAEQILTAIEAVKKDSFWRDKMTPTIFLRTKNQSGEPVDYIAQLLHGRRGLTKI